MSSGVMSGLTVAPCDVDVKHKPHFWAVYYRENPQLFEEDNWHLQKDVTETRQPYCFILLIWAWNLLCHVMWKIVNCYEVYTNISYYITQSNIWHESRSHPLSWFVRASFVSIVCILTSFLWRPSESSFDGAAVRVVSTANATFVLQFVRSNFSVAANFLKTRKADKIILLSQHGWTESQRVTCIRCFCTIDA